MTAPLLELQAADTMADQLRHRRGNLPEREQLQAAKNDLIRWDQSLQTVRRRLDELNAEIEQAEQRSRSIDTKKSRLQAQLKTVIAPREAEALQSEIAVLDRERRELDDAELAALEEQSRLDDDLQGLLAQEEPLREAFLAADAVLSSSQADIDGELDRIARRLQGLRDAVDAKLLKQYDRLRQHHVVAAAGLSGSRCDGCHLDLSAAELDEVRGTAAKAGGIAECPHCGRLLVV
ncbi:MAG TPA: C4-type zinc ribbon domain-containing protein [Ilumatobacter sp.]|nr:C4-type zinc ribbon domain-containing protein [Ilumatobacter sp.]